MPKMTIRVILKSGSEFAIKCDEFTLKQTALGASGYDIKGITENKPIYLDFEQIAAVVRTFSDEQPEAAAPETEKEQSFTETKTKCPFCEGENENAIIYADNENKEFFVYCQKCGIETKDVFSSKAKALKAFSDGKTKSVVEKEAGGAVKVTKEYLRCSR